MTPNGVEDEDKFLASGVAGIQQNAFHMHRALVFSQNPQFFFQYLYVFLGFQAPKF